MKTYMNCDYDKLQEQTPSVEPMFRRDNKKMSYDRELMVKANGKYSSKQSDSSRKISHAKYLRRRENQELEKIREDEERSLREEAEQEIITLE